MSPTLNIYMAYGLGIRSELPLPELTTNGKKWDVAIRLGRVKNPFSKIRGPGGWEIASPEKAYFIWENVGTFMVKGGKEIIIDPARGVAAEVLRLIILGQAMAVLLHQRGYLILHASAIEVEGGVVAFLGASGSGKSAMIAALNSLGYGLVADDVVAVDMDNTGEPLVFSAMPQIKLWPETAAIFGDGPEELPRVHPQLEKRALRRIPGFKQTCYPLRLLYVIAEGTRTDPEFEPIPLQEALLELVRYSYILNLWEDAGGDPKHFYQCGKLVSLVPIHRLKRKRCLADLRNLASLVEKDIIYNRMENGDK
jgi:hypothetical protein